MLRQYRHLEFYLAARSAAHTQTAKQTVAEREAQGQGLARFRRRIRWALQNKSRLVIDC